MRAQQPRHRQVNQVLGHDPLTGLLSAPALEEEFAAYPPDAPGFFLLLDLDSFTAVNDSYGRPTGDEVLRQLATVMLWEIPEDHRLYRYQGEKFAVLMRGSGWSDAIALAERLRAAAAGHRVATPAGPVCVTLSGSLVELEPGADLAWQVCLSETLLAQAKTAGRNRIAVGRPGRARGLRRA